VAPNAEELHVLPIKKFWHVGKFATDTEPNTVLKYVSTKLTELKGGLRKEKCE